MFRDVHMNALNIRKYVKTEGQDIEVWIREVKNAGSEEHPVALMLNHPAHIDRVRGRQPYFRSWWAADRFKGIDLVENFDFMTWFDKLNYGCKLPGLWTTDAHDVAFVPPGKKCTYVYTGNELNEANIINGLIEGRSFNTRSPGAMLYLKVNGLLMGETVRNVGNDDRLHVQVTCQSARPLERVEIVADGKVIKEWQGNRSFQLEADIHISGEMKWVIARAYAYEEDACWPADDTSMEPLLESGCIAFTNPVWIQHHD